MYAKGGNDNLTWKMETIFGHILKTSISGQIWMKVSAQKNEIKARIIKEKKGIGALNGTLWSKMMSKLKRRKTTSEQHF